MTPGIAEPQTKDPAGCGCAPGCVHSHGFSWPLHNVKNTLALAEEACRERGLKLTAQRRAVLEILAEAGKPCGAYDLIEAMRAQHGRAPAPIAMYRALDFLKENGFIHRLETLNAFLACPHHHSQSARVVFLICEACRSVMEAVAEPLNTELAALARSAGFRINRQVVELAGTCATCLATPDHSSEA